MYNSPDCKEGSTRDCIHIVQEKPGSEGIACIRMNANIAHSSDSNLALRPEPLRIAIKPECIDSLAMQMLAAPKSRLTGRIAASNWTLVPPALGYIFLLVHSYQPDTLSLVLPGSLKEGLSGHSHAQIHSSPNLLQLQADSRGYVHMRNAQVGVPQMVQLQPKGLHIF